MSWKPEESAEDWLSPFAAESTEKREPELFEPLESPWAPAQIETEEHESELEDRWEPSGEEEEETEDESESDYSSGEAATEAFYKSEEEEPYRLEEEDTETDECCGGHDGESAEVEHGTTFEVESEDYAVDEGAVVEAEFENEETFDEAEDFAWEAAWGEEEAPRVRPAGSTVIEKVPLLRNHAGIGPDLLLAWNEISGSPTSVDVVVHLHGYSLSSGSRLHIVRDLKSRSGLDWADPNGGSTTPGRSRPTLALLPRGHHYGGRSKRAYSFPALTAVDGLQKLIDVGLRYLATMLGSSSLSRGRLIITAHSGGVASLLRILKHADPHEVHVFDGLYQDAGPLVQWATRRAQKDRGAVNAGSVALRSHMTEQGGALRVLYGGGTARFSRPVDRAMEKLLGRDSTLRRWYRAERTSVGHLKVPPVYGWRLLADAGADVPNAAVEKEAVHRELGEQFAVEGETVAPTGVLVTFASGVTLPVITGPGTATDKDDFWDPVGSRNPLLDTSGSKKDLKLSTSFTVRELTTSGGKSADIARIDPKLVECLQRLRDHTGKSLTITSGFRSWKRNRDVYKARNKTPTKSQHCAGRAADIKIAGMNGLQIAKAAIDSYGPNIGIGVGGTFAHIDVRGVAQAWNYGGATKAWVNEVKQYQRQKSGASPTPVPRTPSPKPSPAFAKPPQELVRFAQRTLNVTEGERLDTDGSLGPKTRAAIDRFAAKYSLPTRGEISEQVELALVQRALEELAQASMFQKGRRDAATEQAIARFRTQRALGTDATLDAATRAALADALEQRTRGVVVAPSPAELGADWTNMAPRNRMRYVMRRLVESHRYPANGAAGVVGNLLAESGVLPNRIEGSKRETPMVARDNNGVWRKWTAQEVMDRIYKRTGPVKGGVGLAQWTSANRRKGLFRYSHQGRVLGAEIMFNMDAQIDYLVQELGSDYVGVDRVLRRSGVSLNDACDEVLYNFEVPGSILFPKVDGVPRRKRPRTDPAVVAKFEERRTHARSALEAYETQTLVEQVA